MVTVPAQPARSPRPAEGFPPTPPHQAETPGAEAEEPIEIEEPLEPGDPDGQPV